MNELKYNVLTCISFNIFTLNFSLDPWKHKSIPEISPVMWLGFQSQYPYFDKNAEPGLIEV
jgi:hypothetical protein